MRSNPQGEYAEAEQLYLLVIHAYELEPATLTVRNFESAVNRAGTKTGPLLHCLTSLRLLLQDMSRLKEADSLFRTLLAISEEYFGPCIGTQFLQSLT